LKNFLSEFLFLVFGLFIYFIIILVAGRFNMWVHIFLLGSFALMNRINRAWVRSPERIGIENTHISKIEKVILFPGLPNSFSKGSVKFQRLLVSSTIVALILMLTVFSSGMMVIFQIVTVVFHFFIHIFLVMTWVK